MDSTTPTQSDLLLRQVTSKLEVTLKIETKPPNALICTICNNLFTDPVIMSCCANSFCAACVLTTLKTSQDYVCPGDGCNQVVGCVGFVTNSKLHGIVTYWLEKSGSAKYREQTQNITRNKLAPVENCPPPSVKCPICADLMTNAITMECCGTNFCNECIATTISCSDDTSCPGVGCTCKEINRASYTINYPLQNVARTWFDRLERLKNAKNLVPTTSSGKTAISQQSNMNSPSDISSQRCSAYKMTRSFKKLANTSSPYNRNNSNKKSEQGRENGKQKQVSRNLRSAFSSKQSSENTSDDQNAIVLD